MADTPNLVLPYIQAAQAQKHVTHNEAIRLLDGMVQLAVVSQVLTAPPGSPVDGDRYIVASGATGLWTGWDLNVAFWIDGAWVRLIPRPGWVAYSVADAGFYSWTGAAWATFGGGGGGGGPTFPDNTFGVTGSADATKIARFEVDGFTTATTRTFTLPNTSSTLAVLAATQTFTGTTTFSGTFDVSAATASLGTSTGTSTANVGTGATLTATTKTVNLGTGGVSGSTTVVNIGSAVAGALGSLVINSPTVTFASSVSAVAMAAANLSALYVGIGGATADATNRLSINTPAVLFNNAGTSIQATLNKNAAGNDAGFVFQTGFSTRALFGTLGSDDFVLKVSPNGSSFFDAFTVARATGRITIANGLVLNPVAADLASPVDGLLWYNSTTGTFRARKAGTTVDVGDVTGPGSSTDNSVARFHSTSGRVLQNSGVQITDNGEVTLPAVAAPAIPAANKINLFARSLAGRMVPAFIGPAGIDSSLQPLLARNKVGYWCPPGNATTVPGVFGFTAPTVTGFTGTARNVATTNIFTRMRRLGYVTAATAGAVGQWRQATAQFTLGDGAGMGGFTYVVRFGISDPALVSDARMFMGVRHVVTPTNVEPSILTQCVGIGHGAADTNLKLFYGGSAAQTPIDLGANFPINTSSVDMYELALFAAPNATDIDYEVTRLNTGHVATGTLSGAGTAVPNATTLIGPWGYRTNNASALAVAIDVASAYIETDV